MQSSYSPVIRRQELDAIPAVIPLQEMRLFSSNSVGCKFSSLDLVRKPTLIQSLQNPKLFTSTTLFRLKVIELDI